MAGWYFLAFLHLLVIYVMYEFLDILVGEILQNATEFVFELHAYPVASCEPR